MTGAVERAARFPEVTLVFWLIKIAATTLGETGGETVTMTLNWGYLAGSALFLAVLAVLVLAQIAVEKFHPVLYWATIVASTTLGTTMADFADRSLGIGYAGGSALLLACVVATLGAWYWSLGTIYAEGRGVLLAVRHLLADAGHRARRLDRGRYRAMTAAHCCCRRACPTRRSLSVDQRVAGVSVLGRVHPDPAVRRHRWRYSRQAAKRWQPRAQPSDRLGGNRRLHRCLHPVAAATCRHASRAIGAGVAVTVAR